MAWLREIIDGDCESLAYRVAGILLLLFDQPLTKIAALPTSAITITENDMRISLGQEPIPVPQPFADMLANHNPADPNLGATAEMAATPWLFPSSRPGRHLVPNLIMWASPGIVKASLKLQPVGLQRVSRIGSVASMPPSCAGAGCCRSPGTRPPRPAVPELWW